jgi:rhodanese-related sulfurtransferase
MKPTVGFRTLVERAEAEIRSLSPAEVAERISEPGVLLVDIRDVRELKREGQIPGAVHVPRCMMEFWIDPESPYYKDYFGAAEQIILYCNLGWRSALTAKTVQDMGMTNVVHMAGGFEEWKKDGGAVEGGPP